MHEIRTEGGDILFKARQYWLADAKRIDRLLVCARKEVFVARAGQSEDLPQSQRKYVFHWV